MKKPIRAFVIGSSFVTILPFEFSVLLMGKINYKQYSFLAPLYFGMLNTLSTLASPKDWPLTKRLFLTSLVSFFLVFCFGTLLKIYDFSNEKEQIQYAIGLFVLHLFVWNVLILFLETHV